MNKWLKITLYIILGLAIIAVIRLMCGNTTPDAEITNTEETLVEEEINSESIPDYENSNTFEEDVMKDLEGLFGNNNGYEDVQGEYGFNNPEDE